MRKLLLLICLLAGAASLQAESLTWMLSTTWFTTNASGAVVLAVLPQPTNSVLTATGTNTYVGTGRMVLESVTDSKAPIESPTFTGTNTIPTLQSTIARLGNGQVTNNLAAWLGAGNTNYVDFTYASRTNSITDNITFAYATNGVANQHMTHVRWIVNSSGGDLTAAFPTAWRTNIYSVLPQAFTNNVITKMVVEAWGSTSDAASQTNVFVSFEYFK